MTGSHQIEGYAIISEDGMLADAERVMPASLKFKADAKYFEQGLDRVDVVVHGRHSQEQQKRSRLRRRLVLTSRVPALAPHPSNERAWLWNPAGASFAEAMATLGQPTARIGVIGGPDVFARFLDLYDVFHLTRAPDVWLPGGHPVFPEVPARRPEEILSDHGLKAGPTQMLDPANNLTLVSWKRV